MKRLAAALGVALIASSPASADERRLAERLQACAACHGKEGRATPQGYYPRIAGKPAGYLFQQLQHFRDGRRQNGDMAHLLATMPDDYLREIAGHFAALDLPYPAPPPTPARPDQLQRGEQLARQGDPALRLPACAACHGERLTGRLPDVPGLLGLPRDYLAGQIGAWQTRIRRAHAPDCMADVARRLSPADLAAVSAWLAATPLPTDTRPAPAFSERLPLDCGAAR